MKHALTIAFLYYGLINLTGKLSLAENSILTLVKMHRWVTSLITVAHRKNISVLAINNFMPNEHR